MRKKWFKFQRIYDLWHNNIWIILQEVENSSAVRRQESDVVANMTKQKGWMVSAIDAWSLEKSYDNKNGCE